MTFNLLYKSTVYHLSEMGARFAVIGFPLSGFCLWSLARFLFFFFNLSKYLKIQIWNERKQKRSETEAVV